MTAAIEAKKTVGISAAFKLEGQDASKERKKSRCLRKNKF